MFRGSFLASFIVQQTMGYEIASWPRGQPLQYSLLLVASWSMLLPLVLPLLLWFLLLAGWFLNSLQFIFFVFLILLLFPLIRRLILVLLFLLPPRCIIISLQFFLFVFRLITIFAYMARIFLKVWVLKLSKSTFIHRSNYLVMGGRI